MKKIGEYGVVCGGAASLIWLFCFSHLALLFAWYPVCRWGSFVRLFFAGCVVVVLCGFAVGLVGSWVLVGGGGVRALVAGFVVGFRWCSWLSVGWLLSAGFFVWLSGLRGASAGWLVVAGSWLVFGFGVVLVVGAVGSGVGRRSVWSPPVVRRSPVVWCAGAVRLCGGRARLVGAPCPFSVVVLVSVPVGRAGVVFGWSSSGAVASFVVGSLASGGWVAALVPGSSVVVGGVCSFQLVVAL